MSDALPEADLPIVVLHDRYGGAYSGGRWLATSKAYKLENGAFGIPRALAFGPYGGDGDAMDCWHEGPDWIAVGDTPDEAIANRRNSLRPKSFRFWPADGKRAA